MTEIEHRPIENDENSNNIVENNNNSASPYFENKDSDST